MSEPNSLFARISIVKENLEVFLSATPKKPVIDSNWSNWWNSRQMVSPHPLTSEDLYAYNEASNKAILEGWQKEKNTGTFYEYDEARQTLNLGIIFFSENFGEMIPMLSFLFDLAEYKNDNLEDFVIVYPYFWGDSDLSVWITFDEKNLLLDNQLQNINDVDSEKIKYTEDYLNKKTQELFRRIKIKYNIMNLQRKKNVSKILGVLSLIFLVVSVFTILISWNIRITQDVRIAVWLYSAVISFILAITAVLFHRDISSWITLACSGIAFHHFYTRADVYAWDI